METLIWIGRVLFLVVAMASAARAMYLNHRFQRYLQEQHREQWQRIYQDQLIKKTLLWPFMQGTPVDFLWKSREDFGDLRITDFRRAIRQSFLGAVSAGIATVVWFVISAVVLESWSTR